MNLAVAAHVVHRLVARLPEPSWAMTALILTFFPLAYTVFVGQPIIIMLFAFTQAYLAWERGRDFEAGLWCGVLSLKIQYPVFVTLVLMAKGRWRAVAGVATTTAAIFLSSWAVYGTRGMLAFLRTMRELSGFRTVHPFTCPQQMINWRGLLVNVLPSWTTEAQGMILTIVLSLLTASTLVVIWRGPWNPTGPRFASQMLGTMLVTMLANFHNHIHGATLLLVPALAVMARVGMPPTLGGIMRAVALCADPRARLHLPGRVRHLPHDRPDGRGAGDDRRRGAVARERLAVDPDREEAGRRPVRAPDALHHGERAARLEVRPRGGADSRRRALNDRGPASVGDAARRAARASFPGPAPPFLRRRSSAGPRHMTGG